MEANDRHGWARARLTAWRAGLLSETDAAALARHLEDCEACRRFAEAFDTAGGEAGAHVAASLVADWPRASASLRGLERALVRHHLERCAECRQDLEALGHAPKLEWVEALETWADLSKVAAEGVAPAVAASTTTTAAASETVRVVRFETVRERVAARPRGLVAWASFATAAALVAIVFDVHGRLVEALSKPIVGTNPPIWASASTNLSRGFAGLSLRIAPRPLSLWGPARGEGEGKLNVIPIVGPVRNLALGFKPLNVPDTSMVTVSLLGAAGDTLFAVRYRQWEFEPRRMLLIDRHDAPLAPGQYALVLASLIDAGGAPSVRSSRYRFELRPR